MKPDAPNRGPATGDDFDQALRVAEQLLSGVDRGRHRVGEARMLQILVLLAGAVIAVAAAVLSSPTVAIIAVVAAILGLLAGHILLVVPLGARVLRDERAMVEIITVLRELHPHVAEREAWSAVRDRFARERISRFPVAERTRGITTFSGLAADVAKRRPTIKRATGAAAP
ncbi:hypothetical protein GCM10009765_05580 [Fodinicola feengrottensis]|uniref:Uncharacterized protein n=1 Tax=Fodinicola feengrottensis TaxID=435914 RepID=A0ABN2FU41_9ACTN